MNIEGWEQKYQIGDDAGETNATNLLIELAGNLPPGDAMDLACGTGRNALYLAARDWTVTAIDGSETAIGILRQRCGALGLVINAQVADLTSPTFALEQNAFDLVVIAFYLQRDLIPKAMASVRPGGMLLTIAHTPKPGELWTEKRAASGELRGLFKNWEVLWDYEGPSRDPAHRQPVAELAARRPLAGV